MHLHPPERAFAPFYSTPVVFCGERKDDRKLTLPVDCMVVEDSPLTVADAPAPVRVRVFDIAFPRASWPHPTGPEVGEWLKLCWNGHWIWAKANDVGHLPDGDITVNAVLKPEDAGGPPWLR